MDRPPVLDEILRLKPGEAVKPAVLKRWQQTIRKDILPLIAAIPDPKGQDA